MAAISLKAARVNRGLTQEALAERLGISRDTYMRIEADPARASIRMANSIISILGEEARGVFLPSDSTAGCQS